eukprot:169773-Pleurochrysis_carterae.AAC.1
MELYSKRVEYKSRKNPIQLVFKLMMNSSYGITGLKPVLEVATLAAGLGTSASLSCRNAHRASHSPRGHWLR